MSQSGTPSADQGTSSNNLQRLESCVDKLTRVSKGVEGEKPEDTVSHENPKLTQDRFDELLASSSIMKSVQSDVTH
eukprot:109377-Karenia_brevis.AAC.1